MIKKEVGIGFLVGLIANAVGLFLAIQLFGNGDGIETTIKQAIANGFFGKLLSIGAILNLIAFFIFLKKKQDYRARGVLLATILVAIVSFIFI
jgi:ABC-type antimicrobial peptide transport system permease subunit